MRLLRAILGLALGGLPGALSAEPPASIKKTLEVYGSKTTTSIAVRVDGEGITKPGIYHVSPKTELLELIASAGISRISNGRFHVSRRVDGYERDFGFRFSREKRPELPAFELLDGDFLYAGINLP